MACTACRDQDILVHKVEGKLCHLVADSLEVVEEPVVEEARAVPQVVVVHSNPHLPSDLGELPIHAALPTRRV